MRWPPRTTILSHMPCSYLFIAPMGARPLHLFSARAPALGMFTGLVGSALFSTPDGGSKTPFCARMLTCPNAPVSLPTCMYPGANFCAPIGGSKTHFCVRMLTCPNAPLSLPICLCLVLIFVPPPGVNNTHGSKCCLPQYPDPPYLPTLHKTVPPSGVPKSSSKI